MYDNWGLHWTWGKEDEYSLQIGEAALPCL